MSTMSECAITLDAAHEYIERGWHVLVVQPKSKDPYFKFAPRAYLSATNNHHDIDEWFAYKPNLNIGIAAIQSGLVIVDVDYRNVGERAEAILDQLPNTYTIETADGLHLYYVDPGTIRFPGKLADGLDVKHKGYVVAAPSVHPTGAIYREVVNCGDPVPFPTHILGARR